MHGRFSSLHWLISIFLLGGGLAGSIGCATPPMSMGDDDDDGPNPDRPDAGPPRPVCSGEGSAAQPFGNHALPYSAGAIVPNHLDRDEIDAATTQFYDQWKGRYLKTGGPCGQGNVYVATNMENSITVSEAHGYGMLVLAYMAGHDPQAKTLFDGMYAYFRAHPSDSNAYLMAWSQDASCNDNQGVQSASDGDLDIAYALLLADKQWGSGGAINYRAEADKVIDAIRAGDVDASGSYILLGDWVAPGSHHYRATRTSDFMPGHFASFAAATGDNFWAELNDAEYDVIATLQTQFAASTGLLPDFVVDPTSSPAPAEPNFLENPSDGAYSYNACRDPWRLGVHYITTGDARAQAAASKLSTWISGDTGGNAEGIKAGYELDGSSLGRDYFSHAYVAPFGVGAMVDAAHQSWLNSVWDATVENDGNNYYDDTIKVLSMVAMSGNWWAPEAAPCPL